MKLSRFLSAPVFSFFDLKIYRESIALSAGKALLYITYLSALFTAALLILGVTQLPKAVEFVDWLKKNASGITISQTGMSLDVPGRRELNHPQLGALAVLDDTRETISPEEMGNYRIYMTSKMIYIRQKDVVQSNVIGSRAKEDFKMYIDQAVIQKLYDRVKIPAAVLILLGTFILGFISRALMALVLALFGLLVQNFAPRGLSFGALFNLAAFALSSALIFSILQLVPWLAPFSPGFLGALLALAYFVIGITVQPKPQL